MSPRVMPENRIPDIVAAAVSVFSRKGYRLTQMEEIAREANVSKATLYYYFKSKIQLFQYVLEHSGGDYPPLDAAQPKTERDFLQMLKKRLKKGTELKSVSRFLGQGSPGAALVDELRDILNEIWDINEHNRVQIIILEKSLFEFPELAAVYDKYARGRILDQLKKYLQVRMNLGVIKSLHSVEATARFLMEALAWFGFKQPAPPHRMFAREDTMPDLTAILATGLQK